MAKPAAILLYIRARIPHGTNPTCTSSSLQFGTRRPAYYSNEHEVQQNGSQRELSFPRMRTVRSGMPACNSNSPLEITPLFFFSLPLFPLLASQYPTLDQCTTDGQIAPRNKTNHSTTIDHNVPARSQHWQGRSALSRQPFTLISILNYLNKVVIADDRRFDPISPLF